jgi:hypothetical protein
MQWQPFQWFRLTNLEVALSGLVYRDTVLLPLMYYRSQRIGLAEFQRRLLLFTSQGYNVRGKE